MAYISIKKAKQSDNKKIIKNKVKTVFIPAFLTAASIAIIIYVLVYFKFDLKYGSGSSLLVFASLGSSSFIIFMTPKSKAAESSKFIKSYLLASIIGYMSYTVGLYIGIYASFFIGVFIISILMYLLGAEHPPAVGVVLAFILFSIGIYGIFLIIISVLLLLIIKYLFNELLSKFTLFSWKR